MDVPIILFVNFLFQYKNIKTFLNTDGFTDMSPLNFDTLTNINIESPNNYNNNNFWSNNFTRLSANTQNITCYYCNNRNHDKVVSI